MAASKTYLVPIDFSKGSEIALKRAIGMARESGGRLLLIHVISMTFAFPLEVGFTDLVESVEKEAREGFGRLARRMRLKSGEHRSIIVRGNDTAQAIAAMAKKAKAAMIVMASHGRTGLRRFMLGSVAERTLRYAECPVLIVKK